MNEPARTVNERESIIGFLVKEKPRLFASMTDSGPMHPSFSHPDCTVGNGILTVSTLERGVSALSRLRAVTAGREMLPASKKRLMEILP